MEQPHERLSGRDQFANCDLSRPNAVERAHRAHALNRCYNYLISVFFSCRTPYAVLVDLVSLAGLDKTEARELLLDGRFAEDVRQAGALWRSRGINAVPAVVVNDRYLISGGRPPEAFESALRNIAAELAPVD